MIDFKEYLEALQNSFMIDDPLFLTNISKFFVSNNWFGKEPSIENGVIQVDDDYLAGVSDRINEYCAYYSATTGKKSEHLTDKLAEELPQTAAAFSKYRKKVKLDENIAYHVVDFLLYHLAGELAESTDKEVGMLLESAYDNLPKVYGDILADFINQLKRHAKTIYQCEYQVNHYSTKEDTSVAYAPHDYLKILYHLYNSNYIDDNNMYAKAASSKNYVDTWLFLALHFLCSLRNTDIIRIPHPRLPNEPQIVLDQIKDGSFPEEDARLIVHQIMWDLSAFMLTPNKTQGISGVAAIKLHIPESVEAHIGILFAAAEAHFQLKPHQEGEPLLRVITTYEQITRYMGEEIGDLFLDANFHTRSANKSYMQMIYLLTDDILEVNDEFHVKGYMLAAIARSHKGSYGEFAKTTSIYLKDAKMSGLTPEFVAKEMFERGVLSSIPSMLLNMITNKEYAKLSIESQTKMIQTLSMSPAEIEQTVSIMQSNMKRSVAVVNDVFQQKSREEILQILHRIGNGEAVSKQNNCLCLITGMGKLCPYLDNQNCPCCQFEISTKTTMFLMVKEWKRLSNAYKNSQNDTERARYKTLAQQIVLPSIEEMLHEVETHYGKEALANIEKVVKENQ